VGEERVEEETSAKVAPEEAPVFRLSLPWRVAEGPEFYTVHDPTLKEICRVPKTTRSAEFIATYLTAFPWVMIALQHTQYQLTVAEGRKDGTTIRQWLRNHEGAAIMEEIEHAIRVAFDPEAANKPPKSYGLRIAKPTTALPGSEKKKSFREMLGSVEEPKSV
jgi:hypothetical protein